MPTADRATGGSSPADQATVRRHNLALVMRSLADRGPRPRARLAEDTGLTKATVSSLVAELIERGLVVEGQVDRRGLGRPGVMVELDRTRARFVGLELQVDYITGLIIDLTGRVLAQRHLPVSVRDLGPARALGALAQTARDLLLDSAAEVHQVQTVHVAVPGLIDADAGMLSFGPNLHWHDVDVVHTLLGRLQWLHARFSVDNDANMGAMAHFAVGQVAGTANLLYLAGAVGVGGGMIVDGRIVRGAAGFAGEVGHMPIGPPDKQCGCGRWGCWETAVGLAGFLDAVADPGDPVHDESIDLDLRLEMIRERADAGDPRVRAALTEHGRWLGVGVSILSNLLNPEVIVLGGHYPAMLTYLETPVLEALHAGSVAGKAGVARVEFSRLGLAAAALGAAHAGIEELLTDPTLAPLPARSDRRA